MITVTLTAKKPDNSLDVYTIEPTDVQGPLIPKDSLSFRETLYGTEFKPVLNTCSITVFYRTALLTFLQTYDEILFEVEDGATPLFTGFVRPVDTSEYANVVDQIRLEAIDTTALLEATYEDGVFLSTATMSGGVLTEGYYLARADGVKSLVHFLVGKSRFDKTIDVANTDFVQNLVRLERGAQVQEKLAKTLFDHGYVYYAGRDGSLKLFNWAEPDPAATYTFDENVIIKKFRVKRPDRKTKAVTVGYQEYKKAEVKVACLTLAPNYRICDNDPGPEHHYVWPPLRNDLGEITDQKQYDIIFLQPWQAPQLRGVKGEYAWSNTELKIKLLIKRSTFEIFPDRWEDNGTFRVSLNVAADNSISHTGAVPGLNSTGGNSPDWPHDLIHTISRTNEGVSIKLKTPAAFNDLPDAQWGTLFGNKKYEVLVESIAAKGDLVYYFHGKENPVDSEAPRYRTDATATKKLTREYLAETLTDSSRAEALAKALNRGLSASTITFESTADRPLGETVMVTATSKGFSGKARIIGKVWTERSTRVFSYTLETLSPITLTEPAYTPNPLARWDGTPQPPTLVEIQTQLEYLTQTPRLVFSPATIAVPADTGGVVGSFTGINVRVQVFEGEYDTTEQWVLAIAAESGVTGAFGSGADANLYQVSGMASDVAHADFQATRDGSSPVSGRWSISKARQGVDGLGYVMVIESTNGDIFKPGEALTTFMIAHVFENGVEITTALAASRFRWRRVSKVSPAPPNDDATWNSLHVAGYKVVEITSDSVLDRATYFCDLMEE